MSETADPMRIDANPEKRFFISMLTKDIELVPAIIDLVDNCVDGARSLRADGSLKGLRIKLTLLPTSFRIADNCGGIDADVARHYAFRFGRPTAFTGVDSSVGQFGVGMKRALFKLGNSFAITSAAEQSSFRVNVNVPEWAADQSADWSFQFDELQEGTKTAASKRGTDIVVEDLHETVRGDFALPETATRIAQTIALQHQEAIGRGLAIFVNDTPVRGVVPMLLASKAVSPIRQQFDVKLSHGSVSVDLIAGIARARRDDTRDDGEADQFTDPGDAGWFVFCNGRLVLAAETSEVTGWGVSAASFHPQYRRFRGYVFLSAKDSSLLPWNTTKTALDQDSHVFRVIQQRMFSALTAVQGVINRMKTEVQTREEGDRPVSAALAAATETRLISVPISDRFILPPPAPRMPPPPPNTSSIQFKVDRELLERAIRKSGLGSGTKLGLRAFEYYLRHELDEDM